MFAARIPAAEHSARPRTGRRLARGSAVVALTASLVAPAAPAGALPEHAAAPAHRSSTAQDDWQAKAFRGQPQVVAGQDGSADVLDGAVFDDRNRNSVQDRGERGIRGVTVSNGEQVVTTDQHGRYEIPVAEGQTVFLTQPAGWQVPVDGDNVAQFFYTHAPDGSPELEYGGLQPSGALPDAVNFPLARTTDTLSRQQSCLIGGDIQTYDLEEVDYALRGAFTDLSQRTDYTGCGALFVGDIVGDDLSLYPQTRELTSMLNGPARFLPGNHDMDMEADYDHRFDTYTSQFGPTYYSYDVGNAHVIALNSVQYSDGAPYDGVYNGGLDEQQMEWLRQDLAQVPEDKLIVLAAHIPLMDWYDQGSDRHQIDQVREIHELIGDRPAVAFGGHSHTTEFMRAGDSAQGWAETYGVDALPFDHITAGAISGDWYSGRITEGGYPLAVQKDGGLPGVVTLDITGSRYTDRFTATGRDDAEQMSLGLNTAGYRDWFQAHRQHKGEAPAYAHPTTVTAQDQQDTAWLTANVWAGSTGTQVQVSLDGRDLGQAERTQPLTGEGVRKGAEWSDPAAVQEQLVHGGSVAEQSSHLWRMELPRDLAAGEHTAVVTSTDPYGRTSTQELTFTVEG